jgi:hypothetical protein
MFLINAVLRVFHRSWRPMAAIVYHYIYIAFWGNLFAIAVRVVQGRVQGRELLQLPLAFVVGGLLAGCLFGLPVVIFAKSVSIKSGEYSFNLDPLGFVGALIGFVVGGYLGYQDHDNVVRVFDVELNAIATGIIVGPLVVGLLGAILGEVLFPSTQANA